MGDEQNKGIQRYEDDCSWDDVDEAMTKPQYNSLANKLLLRSTTLQFEECRDRDNNQ